MARSTVATVVQLTYDLLAMAASTRSFPEVSIGLCYHHFVLLSIAVLLLTMAPPTDAGGTQADDDGFVSWSPSRTHIAIRTNNLSTLLTTTATSSTGFAPMSKADLKAAIGNCAKGPHGSIG